LASLWEPYAAAPPRRPYPRGRMRFCDESELGFGWIAPTPPAMERACHAVLADGKVWVVDPVWDDEVERRVRELGEPAGVLVLLDRHQRDSKQAAEALGVEVHQQPLDPIDGAPFSFVEVVRNRWWKESALWWEAQRLLLVPEAVGTVDYFRAGDEPLAVHPMLRLTPPRGALAGLEPEHLLVGHGEGLHGPQTGQALREALGASRKSTPSWVANHGAELVRSIVKR
ncbi:MAG: hypothetical protein ACR2NA_07560, partial [Solirubrobacterales bacterium]